jgi:ribosomal 50S subunit-recycling heat shock protein
MRLDLFLKASRLCLRRSVAQEMCDAGVVFVNGIAAKSAKELHVGDRIEIRRRGHILTVIVNSIPASKQVARANAPSLYTIVEDEKPSKS